MVTAIERKQRSEEICRREGVPVNPHLPLVEDESNIKIRTVEEVAWRAMCLCLVSMRAEGMELDQVRQIERDFNLRDKLSPNEIAFLSADSMSDRDRVNFGWRYESCWILLWSLQYIDKLGRPDKVCDVGRAVTIMYESKSPSNFIENASLRTQPVILDEVDLIYRYHWACVDARLAGKPAPAGLHPGVVYERHYAFNWLVGYFDQEWDEVSTDT